MRRRTRFAIYMGMGALAGLVVAAVIIFAATRTDWGMERARVFALGWLKDRVHGTVTVERISGRGLLRGAVLHNVSIVDERGRPFLEADSIATSYSWRTLVSGQIVLEHAVLHRPRIHLEQLPGDTAWNYQYIFADTTPRDTLRPSERTLVMFRNARVIDGAAWVLTGVDSDDVIEPADTARVILERTPTGLAKVMRFENIDADLGRVIWEQPRHEGKLFEVRSASGTGYVFRDPLTLENARGRVAIRDSTITIDFQRVELPATTAALFGNVIHTRGQNYYDIQIDADRFAFADIGWVYPQLPESGGGSARIRIQSQRATNSTLWLAENANIRTEGTNVSGTFGIVMGDTMYFTRVDLRASPLDVALLERLLPGGLPVEGLLVGTVEVKGPLSALETEGDVRLDGSVVKWAGVVDARRGRLAARNLRADVRNFELALVHAFQPAFDVEGRVTGRVTATGRLANDLRFDADLRHQRSGGDTTWLVGNGVLGRERTLDIEVDARAVALSELAHRYPALAGLDGFASGPLHLRGALHDLSVEAALRTRAGPIRFNGRLARERDGPRYAGEAQLSAFQLHELLDRLPNATLSGAVAFDLTGAALATATGNVRVRLDSAQFGRMPIQRSWLDARLADGLLHVDTLHANTLAGDLTARGTIGVVPERSGTIGVDLRSAAVGLLEADLFGEHASTDTEKPMLAGAVRARGEFTGSIANLAGSAEGDVRALVLGPLRMAHGRATLTASALGTDHARLELQALGDSVAAYGHVLHAARLEVTDEQQVSRFRLQGGPPGTDKLAATGRIARAADSMRVTLHELTIGADTAWRLEDSVMAALDRSGLHLSAAVLRRARGVGTVRAGGVLAWSADSADRPVDFRLALEQVPFADFLRVTHSRAAGAGTLDGDLRITGSALQPLIDANLTAARVAYNEVRLERAFAEVAYANEGLELFLEAQHGPQRVFYGGGSVPLDLRFTEVTERRPDRPLNLALTADNLPAAQVLPFLNGFSNVEGRIDGTVRAAGTTLDPALSGELRLERIAASWSASGVRYTDFDGSFRLVSDREVEVQATTRTALPRRGFASQEYGSGTVSGLLDFGLLSNPALDLRFSADRVLAADRRDVQAVVTGGGRLVGRYTQPEIRDVDLRVDRGTMYLDEIYRQFFVVQLDSARVYQFIDTSLVSRRRVLPIAKTPFLDSLRVSNARILVGNESWLRGKDLDVEVEGELNVLYDRRVDDLRITGNLDVVRGTYQLAYPPLQARRFNVRQGSIEFPGLPGIDPNLTIEAVYKGRAETEPLDIIAQVTGSLQNPRVRLTSDEEPPISESDLASYLFFGVPTWKVGTIVGTQNADTRDALAGFGFNTLTPSLFGYASSGLQTLAQSAGLLDYVSLTAAEFAPGSDPANRTDALRNYQLDLGRYLTPNLYLGVSQRLAAGSSQPAARLEWRFHPTFTLELFAEDRFARNGPTLGYNQEAVLKRVYGFFLFREWGY